MNLIIALALSLIGVAAILVVYWLAKRANAKENGEVPPSFLQTMRGLVSTKRGGGKGEE